MSDSVRYGSPAKNGEPVANELLMKLMDNYTSLLDSYIQQQSVQERLLEKFISQNNSGTTADFQVPGERKEAS